jgi:hypothetical protein
MDVLSRGDLRDDGCARAWAIHSIGIALCHSRMTDSLPGECAGNRLSTRTGSSQPQAQQAA